MAGSPIARQERRHAGREKRPADRVSSLLPGAPITVVDIHNMTSIAYPEVCRASMTGERLIIILEDVADNLFHSDPYYQQGGDMICFGGVGYSIDPRAESGRSGHMAFGSRSVR